MGGSEKKFQIVDIVLLVIIALINDALNLASFLLAGIPVLGEISVLGIEIIDFLLWALILFWFIIKMRSFGAPGLLQIGGGIAEMVGIPARTLTVIVGIIIANHPKLSAAASAASGDLKGATKTAAEETGAPRERVTNDLSPTQENVPQDENLAEAAPPTSGETRIAPEPFEDLERSMREIPVPSEEPEQIAA